MMISCARILALGILSASATHLVSAATITDNFGTNANYLTDGIGGTIWDGVYFGAGEFSNTGTGGGGVGATVQCDANLSAANKLSLQTTGTAWEAADDDGFFLFKVVQGSFSARVHVVTPYNNAGYNTAGLQVRAFNVGGNPFGGSEDYVSLTRFDQFGFNNYLRNEINGAVTQIDTDMAVHNGSRVVPSNNNYWLRIDWNSGANVFSFYESDNGASWWPITNSPTLSRADLAGQPLQVGIIHATFNNLLNVQFSDFSIVATNFDAWTAPPTPVTGLTVAAGTNFANISWVSDAASAGSVVVLAAGGGPLRQMPVNGFSYAGNATYGLGDRLLATNCFVVYAGSGTNVTVTNLPAATAFTVGVVDYSGAGQTIAYSRPAAIGSFSTPTPPAPVSSNIVVDPVSPALTNYTSLGEWNTDNDFEGWTTNQVSDGSVSNGIIAGTASGIAPKISKLNFSGPDLDLGFNDQVEVRLQVPADFTGDVQIFYGTTNTPNISASRVITIPNSNIPKDGAFHVYRVDVGLEILWRGNLRDLQINPLGSSASAGQTFAVDYIRVGDLMGEVYLPRYTTSNPAPGVNNELGRPVIEMQSKHFRVLWDAVVATNTAWKTTMPHGTLRNLEETWQYYVKRLGYREPSESWTVANRNGNKYKVNVSTWHSGYWAGNEVPSSLNQGRLNITPDGLRVDPPTWVIPHELGHVFQFHQRDGGQTMDGAQSEAHANYVRERWIYFYGPVLPGWTDDQSNLDSFFAATAHFYHSHGRHYYLHWPIFLYLDENPDGLQDLGEGFVKNMWQQTLPGEYLYTTIARLAPHNNIKNIVALYARRNVAWDYSHRAALTTMANRGDADFLSRWVVAELRQRPDDPTWWQVSPEMAPMQGAYKIHQLIPQGSGAGRVVTVNFHGLPIAARGADWRVSFVVVSDAGVVRYSPDTPGWNSGTNSVTLAANENTVYLVVAATPSTFLFGAFDDTVYPYQLTNPQNPAQSLSQQRTRFPYEIQVTGGSPKETDNGSTAGLIQHANGGGWKATTAAVDASAYIGPNARVLGTAQVRNNARIEDYAVVKNSAQVLNNAVVSGHAVVRNTAIVRDNARIRDYAMVIDNSIAADFARVLQHGELTAGSTASNWATVKGCVSTWKDVNVAASQRAGNDAVLDGDFSTARMVTNGFQFGFLPYDPGPQSWISARTAPRRLYADYEFTAAHDSLIKDFYGVTDGYPQGSPVWLAADGKRNGFLTFNGSNQYVILDRSLSDLQEISITSWIKWAGGGSNQVVWHFGSATNKCTFFTPDDGGGHARFVIRNSGLEQTLVAPAALATGVWTHVALTLSNSVVGRLYINGVLQQQATITITPDRLSAGNGNTNAQYNYLARGVDNSQPFFNGALDSVRVYTGALTNGEIAAMQVANQTPVLAAISNRVVGAGVTLVVTNSASDPDQPWQTLAFSLVNPPAGATIDGSSGVLNWRPAVSQANTTNLVQVRVADNGTPSLSATQSFSVVVAPITLPLLNALSTEGGQFGFTVNGDVGPDYSIQSSTNLLDWTTIFSTNPPVLPFDWIDTNALENSPLFYRVLLGP